MGYREKEMFEEVDEDVTLPDRWIRFTREAFTTDEVWKIVCEECGVDPETTEAVTIHVGRVNVEKKKKGKGYGKEISR